jgi:hypothetical protein
MTNADGTPKRADWSKHIKLELTAKAMKRLQKRHCCQVQVNYQWYWITVSNGPEVFDKNGKKLDKAALRAMLKRMV